jgi:hypothetical protein
VIQAWSNGGGIQSAAIAALICKGELPKPDISVIADTGREASTTWAYFDEVVSPQLKVVSVECHRIPHSFTGEGYNTVDLFSGKDGDTIIMPMYTSSEGNEREGLLPKYCSNEWKTRPIQRFIREQGHKSADLWVGFTIDELERCRAYNDEQPWNHVYPLIDRRMTRGDCIALVESLGWPEPPRSACYMCPLRNDQEWRDISQSLDFTKAQLLEERLQEHDKHVFFHRSCKPLAQVDFNQPPDLFAKPCASGMCFT